MEYYDAIVVGAGPAGSTAAKVLSEKGAKTLLIDKNKFPRNKPCGGALSLKVLDRFKYVKDFVDSYLYGGVFYSPSLKYAAKYEKDRPIGAMVTREKFDAGLVELAINSGAQFIDGAIVKDLKISNEKAKVMLGNGSEMESEIVISAERILSVIARKSGLRQRSNHGLIFPGIVQEFYVDRETMDEFFGEKRLAHFHIRFNHVFGYAWVFPKRESINIGVGGLQTKTKPNLKNILSIYIQSLKRG